MRRLDGGIMHLDMFVAYWLQIFPKVKQTSSSFWELGFIFRKLFGLAKASLYSVNELELGMIARRIVIPCWQMMSAFGGEKLKTLYQHELGKQQSNCMYSLFSPVTTVGICPCNNCKWNRIWICRQLASNGVTFVLTARDEKRVLRNSL